MNKVEKSQKIYTKQTLDVYDFWVHYISNNYAWKCTSKKLLKHYNNNISNNHLDVGVGTGYLLNKCSFGIENPRVGLMDLNEYCLNKTAQKIKRYNPITYKRNILEKINFEDKKYDSICVNYVMHCIPGNFKEKGIVFNNLKKLLNDDGVLFGSTVLSENVSKNLFAKFLMRIYNYKGIFNNSLDNEVDLRSELLKYFDVVNINIIGCVALFYAKINMITKYTPVNEFPLLRCIATKI